ncbi:sensor domain-containing diguanylate cyclase [Ferrovibrio sp.]|uniref:sensor domain-containing diguanylate cyclase n=1 Tax=Ferrovibrio sp. TaxID=1917215 RepID=UPI001B797DEC|nr:sensor domain-containing diguanylate cyclase [Ferrovibrio sp.]MBP7065288.1 diguanylate cyclase [Ferrovibrio sp.]
MEPASNPSLDLIAAAALEPAALIPVFPGPAALFDGNGAVLFANRAAGPLLDALAADRLVALAAALDASLADGLPRQEKADLPGLRGGTALHLTLLPHGGQLLLLGRDTTLERNLLQALMQSRQLFRDLVACSTDFAWETKPDGRFGFVSPRGAMGYTARELEGHVPTDFAAPDSPETPRPTLWPFTATAPQEAVEVFLRRKDGSVGCFEVSCVAVRDGKGEWAGTRGVARDVTEARERVEALRRAHKTLNTLANTDGLTGLLNRRAFLDELEKRLSRHHRNRLIGTLIYFDLDNFKKVNDVRGHQAGDEVLKAVAEAVRKTLRVVDLASRIGGDEFLLWLEETGRDSAASMAARLMEAAAEINKQWGVEGFPLGFSIGAVFSRLEAVEGAEALVARADAAMYVAKKGGKGRTHIAEEVDPV